MAENARTEAIMLTLAGLFAAEVARKVVDVVWVAASGKHAPDPNDPDETMARAISGALVMGAVLAVVRMSIGRKTRELKRRRAQN